MVFWGPKSRAPLGSRILQILYKNYIAGRGGLGGVPPQAKFGLPRQNLSSARAGGAEPPGVCTCCRRTPEGRGLAQRLLLGGVPRDVSGPGWGAEERGAPTPGSGGSERRGPGDPGGRIRRGFRRSPRDPFPGGERGRRWSSNLLDFQDQREKINRNEEEHGIPGGGG